MPVAIQRPTSARPRDRLNLIFRLVALGLAMYFALSYSGLYRWFAELQVSHTGKYYPKLTLVFTYLALALPAELGWRLGQRIAKRSRGDDAGALAFNGDFGMENMAPSLTRTRSNRIQARWRFGWAIVAVVFWIIGGSLWYMYKRSDALAHTSIEDWESGRAPQTCWVDLHGKALAKAAIRIGDRDHGEIYVPVISDKWRVGQSVQVFLRFRSDDEYRRGAAALDHEGIVGWCGMPGEVRERFESHSLVPAENYSIIEVGVSPEKRRNAATVAIIIGCVAMVAQCVVSLIYHAQSSQRDY